MATTRVLTEKECVNIAKSRKKDAYGTRSYHTGLCCEHNLTGAETLAAGFEFHYVNGWGIQLRAISNDD